MEGALKLKELYYIQAEGCSVSEMKHDPIAVRDRTHDKIAGQIEQTRARGDIVVAAATEGGE